jgi:peptidoglycan/xylan/chitin deacetylase (PgdA/CDA1 family)
MRIPGLGRIGRTVRRVRNRFAPAALVLLYHRVTRLDTDPQWLAVAPERFDEQLDLLKRCYNVLPLSRLVAALRENALPKRSVAITFDDGYADNLFEAKPILERHGLPATVFVSSGFVGRREEFFWDELDRLLLQPGELPRELNAAPPGDGVGLASPMSCRIGADEPWCWDLGDDAAYSAAAARSHRGWNVLDSADPTARHAAYRALCPALAGADPELRARWLDQIRAWAGAAAKGRESHRAMTAGELNRLAGGGLIEVGGHTVTHPRLSSLAPDGQRREMAEGRAALEQLLGRPVPTFAYPFGNHADYTADTVRLAREVGFEAACSNFGGAVRHGADAFQLNRVLVRDWPAEELDRRIGAWFRD